MPQPSFGCGSDLARERYHGGEPLAKFMFIEPSHHFINRKNHLDILPPLCYTVDNHHKEDLV